MSYEYMFSVGAMKIQEEGGGAEVGVGIMTEITVSYDGDPQSFYGGDYRLPLAVELGNRSGEISASSSRWQITDTMLTNNYIDVVLSQGPNSGGLTGTIQACKLTSYSVTSSQNEFSTSDIMFTICDVGHIAKGSTAPTWNADV